jgi:hypothetical protein
MGGGMGVDMTAPPVARRIEAEAEGEGDDAAVRNGANNVITRGAGLSPRPADSDPLLF